MSRIYVWSSVRLLNYTKQWNETSLMSFLKKTLSTWFIKALLTCYILLWFGNPESDKNHCHDPEEGCCYPHLEMLCLVLQCFIYNPTIASLFNNTGSFDPCFQTEYPQSWQSILSAVANKRLITYLSSVFGKTPTCKNFSRVAWGDSLMAFSRRRLNRYK